MGMGPQNPTKKLFPIVFDLKMIDKNFEHEEKLIFSSK